MRKSVFKFKLTEDSISSIKKVFHGGQTHVDSFHVEEGAEVVTSFDSKSVYKDVIRLRAEFKRAKDFGGANYNS